MDVAYRSPPLSYRGGIVQRLQRRESLVPVSLAAGLFYTLLIPEQFNPTLGGLYMPPFRAYLLGAAMYILFGTLRSRIRLGWPDMLIILGSAWIWLAAYQSSGSLSTAAIMGGSHTVDIALAYFLARVAIQSPKDFRTFLILIAPGLGFASFMVVLESISQRHIIQPVASALTGVPSRARLEERMGLVRGIGPFPHPIHAGILLASFLPLYVLSGLRGWPKWVGIIASIGGIFSMSSAAMLGVVVGGGLLIYDWLSERIANLTWRLFLIFSAMLYVGVETTSNSGFYNLLVRYASLNTGSAYNRVLIWQFGSENVARHPWFGIGYGDWDRPSWMYSGSFDHFWLILALRWGLPNVLLLLIGTLLAIVMVVLKSRDMPLREARTFRGVAISLSVFALGVNSVSLWLVTLAWFFMLVGLAVSMGQTPAPAAHHRRIVLAGRPAAL